MFFFKWQTETAEKVLIWIIRRMNQYCKWIFNSLMSYRNWITRYRKDAELNVENSVASKTKMLFQQNEICFAVSTNEVRNMFQQNIFCFLLYPWNKHVCGNIQPWGFSPNLFPLWSFSRLATIFAYFLDGNLVLWSRF